jgi:hypothetical protein
VCLRTFDIAAPNGGSLTRITVNAAVFSNRLARTEYLETHSAGSDS